MNFIKQYLIVTVLAHVAVSQLIAMDSAGVKIFFCAVGDSHVAATSAKGFSDDGDTSCNAGLVSCADDDVDYAGGREWWRELHRATEADDYDKCCELLDAGDIGINVDVRDERGQTSFFKAVLQGNQLIADLLLAFGANREAKDQYGKTVLHWAVKNTNIEALEYLLGLKDPRVNVNVFDKWGSTPLHAAAALGHAEMVKKLLEHPDINSNTQNEDGDTPLHSVMFWGMDALHFADRYEVIKLLLSHPHIDSNIKNNKGLTALEYCQKQPFIWSLGGSPSECFFDFLIYKANVGNLFLGEDVFFKRAHCYRVFRRRIILCAMQKTAKKAATHTAHTRRLKKPFRIDRYSKEKTLRSS
ncbi:MAG: ankyrin repeat domain-containing protein [bacterium]